VNVNIEPSLPIMKRDFLAIPDFETDELYETLDLAHRMKGGEYRSGRWRE
jgi:ornithine carbamoyltransferase